MYPLWFGHQSYTICENNMGCYFPNSPGKFFSLHTQPTIRRDHLSLHCFSPLDTGLTGHARISVVGNVSRPARLNNTTCIRIDTADYSFHCVVNYFLLPPRLQITFYWSELSNNATFCSRNKKFRLFSFIFLVYFYFIFLNL